jgi:hypothetical protein
MGDADEIDLYLRWGLLEREMAESPAEWSVQPFVFARDCRCTHCRRGHAAGELTHAFVTTRALWGRHVRFPLCNRCHGAMVP